MILGSNKAQASELPKGFYQNAPVLVSETKQYWPDMTSSDKLQYLAAQVEQETCISLKSKSCWSSKAELNTWRERGVGLGQITMLKDDSMDALAGIKAAHRKELSGWGWNQNLYDPKYQLRALVLLDHDNYKRVVGTKDEFNHLAFTFLSYNGGAGRMLSDRKVCSVTKHCDSNVWFGNVEKTSKLPHSAVKGYSVSFFQVTRDYVQNVMKLRGGKYAPELEKMVRV